MNEWIIFKIRKWSKWAWVKAKNNPMYSIPIAIVIIIILGS
ncbi:hypothetical protein [uncultured Mediterranean phage uvMED]|jgi:hypothetical protein|nr:hypothetical protein [uncultured Mediterranean phage uvMED]BAQ91435.1 hypothetical protein [uncultured Mediterranean phage uvMED]BAQ91535.1 hypothetical protein [uncultured Mediterranean phage uvMED]|tara:strand:- start:587 stop:709 length:123 start_codon:yes stop_codon:yes gene_type:complete